ncbi:MAG: hypothetical protein AAF694_23745 [Bacteroidota bacterium]
MTISLNRKATYLAIIFCLFGSSILAQTSTSNPSGRLENDKDVRESALQQIEQEREENNEELTKMIDELDQRIKILDKTLERERDAETKVERLVERVQTLEAIQRAINQKELNVYQRNYQSAIINLVSMERELKPLILFNSSREFFSGLTDVSNPMRYEGYEQWFKTFKSYVSRNKNRDPGLNILNNLITISGNLAQGAPLTGPFTQVLFSGMSQFIEGLGSRQRDLKTKSEKMFQLTVVLSQFTHEQQMIENEWESINAELEELKKLHENSLQENFAKLNIEQQSFQRDFTRQNDAKRRLDYLNTLTKLAEKHVEGRKKSNPDRWKEEYYYEMSVVQSLKIRFGNITSRIKENIKMYDELLKKFENDPLIKSKIISLQGKLAHMDDAFDKTFNPSEYIDSASKMYVVY